jgi:5S rRNA maturation endonuclease (ribonuclease M5)
VLKTLTPKQRESLDLQANHYNGQSRAVEGYMRGRGFGQDAVAHYRLGAVVEPLAGHEEYVGRLAIPYYTPAGTVDLRFRCVQPHHDTGGKCEGHGKYLSRSGVSAHLYNVAALWRDARSIVVAEGEIDAMTMDFYVGMPAVGVPGANQWQSHWARLLSDYDRVYVMCDDDDAGRTFGRTVVKAVDEAVSIHMPEGHDVNSLYLSGGRDAVLTVMGL